MKNKKYKIICPCGSSKSFADCCQPYISGDKPAPGAEALMRSRYTAYALRDVQYLLHSWHESTRPETLELEQNAQWIRLRIIASSEDRVEFVAICRVNGKAHKLRENSRFVRERGRWYYLDAHV